MSRHRSRVLGCRDPPWASGSGSRASRRARPCPLAGVGAYEFHALGCGVQPSPCTPGSGTTDPTVQLCGPIYVEAVEGTVKTTRKTTADADGTARATIRFVVPESERVCPADPSFPWYVNSGEWRLRVNDRAHGLRLVGPPHLLIGP